MSFSSGLHVWLAATALGTVVTVAGCSAVYPELQTPVRSAEGREIEAPPSGLRWVAFKGATVPAETRDGRKWGSDLGRKSPDPYAVLLVNGKLLIKTPSQAATLTPSWADGPAGNFRLKDTDRYRVELWDSNTINDHPIGVKEIGRLDEEVERTGEADVECDSGAHVRIAFEPAHGRLGLGFYYELRIGEAYVTRMYQESPAGRAGIKPGDQIMILDGKPVANMKTDEVKSILNTPHMNGLGITIRHGGGQELALTLKEGAIYPLFSEMGTLR